MAVAMYGAHVAHRYAVYGDKGKFISDVAATALALLIGFSNRGPSSQLLHGAINRSSNLPLVVFISYFFLMLCLSPAYIGYYTRIIFDIGVFFLLGVLYSSRCSAGSVFGIIESRLSTKATEVKAGIGAIFFFTMASQLTSSVENLGVSSILLSIGNDYYQSLGDYFVIAYLSWLGFRQRSEEGGASDPSSYLGVLLLVIEVIASVLFLQFYGSNKASLVVVLSGCLFFYYYSLKNLTKAVIAFIALLLPVSLALTELFDQNILSGFRFFRELSQGSLLENTSWVSRAEQFYGEGLEQLQLAPLLGDLTIADEYLHSSVLSLQTHLGIIGSLLFWLYFAIKLYKLHSQVYQNDFGIKLMALPIVGVSVISSAFWWPPLWFIAGALFLNQRRV
jgi:hypothetical protein